MDNKLLFTGLVGLAGTLLSLTASASPNIRYGVQGSSFIVYATNDSDRQYNCQITYRLNYKQYGEDGSQNFNQQFVVRPKLQNGVVARSDTSWAASTLVANDVNYSCT